MGDREGEALLSFYLLVSGFKMLSLNSAARRQRFNHFATILSCLLEMFWKRCLQTSSTMTLVTTTLMRHRDTI